MFYIARRLNTSVVWVQRCMMAYGRRPARLAGGEAESRETRLEKLEADEPEEREERAPEESEDLGTSGKHELREKPPRPDRQATPNDSVR